MARQQRSVCIRGSLLLLVPMIFFGTTAAVYADWISTISSENPLSWYRFEEEGGTTAADSGSGGNNGTYTDSVTLGQEGLVGKAAQFAGNRVSLNSLTTITGPWTAEFILQTSNPSYSHSVAGRSGSMTLKTEQWEDTGRVGYTEYGVKDYLFTPTSPGSDVLPAPFAHLVFVNGDTQMSLYINGVLAGTNATTIDFEVDSIAGPESYYGLIDEAVFYDRALSSSDVQQHFAAIPEPSTPVLLLVGGLTGALVLQRRN